MRPLLKFVALIAALAGPTALAGRVERGNLVYDNIPEAPAGLVSTLNAYLNARQATPLAWSPSGQLLIATRFGDTIEQDKQALLHPARSLAAAAAEPMSAFQEVERARDRQPFAAHQDG